MLLYAAIYSHHFSARFRPKPRCRPGVRAFGLKASSGKMRFWFLCCHSALWPWQIFILHGQAAAILPSKLQPGPASITHDPGSSSYFLTNGVLNARVSIKEGILQPVHLTNTMSGQRLPDPEYAFQVEIAGGRISSRDFRLLSANLSRLEPQAEASQLSLRHSGWSISFLLATESLEARWSVVLRDDSNSIKVAFRMWPRPNQRDSALRVGEVCLLSGILNGGAVAGSVEGVPIVSEHFFLGMEHPKATNSFKNELYTCCLAVQKATALQVWQGSLTVGVVVPGQARRSFLHYLERERAHPSRRMLHYNTWYDIGTGQQFSAREAEARLQHISNEMSRRGVVLDAFLLDDGWDDPDRGPWEPHDGFSSEALAHLEEISKGLGTSLGVWFSPFGGYHEPRQRRISAARQAGIPVREEVRERIPARLRDQGEGCSATTPCGEGEGRCQSNNDCKDHLECWHTASQVSPPGIDLSNVQDPDADVCFDPGVQSAYLGLGIKEYFVHFQAVLLRWIARGARLLKLDGIGNPSGMPETLQEDFDSAVALIAALRTVSSDIFINLSTGTWPSPFWLLHSDTVWRRGHDHYFEGPDGPARERWISYRDAMVYKNVVKESPLFPLNSLMIHGIIFAKDAWDLNAAGGGPMSSVGGIAGVDAGGSSRDPFKHEVRSAFGSGAMLQELYVTPALLQSGNWDDLAEAALWASSCVDTMVDVQWFGGDPARGEIYGWAAWSTERSILTLRNPAPTLQVVQLEPIAVFDLPNHAAQHIQLNAPFPDQRPRQIFLKKGDPTSLQMPPYSVFVFDSRALPPTALVVYLDILRDSGMPLFWTLVLVTAAWVFRHSTQAPASVPSVPIEELRRRRLQALERRNFT